MTNNSLRERTHKMFLKFQSEQEGFRESRIFWSHKAMVNLLEEFESELSKARQQAEKEIAQECYLQCLAAECGEGECAEAIYTKFPKLISRFDPQ